MITSRIWTSPIVFGAQHLCVRMDERHRPPPLAQATSCHVARAEVETNFQGRFLDLLLVIDSNAGRSINLACDLEIWRNDAKASRTRTGRLSASSSLRAFSWPTPPERSRSEGAIHETHTNHTPADVIPIPSPIRNVFAFAFVSHILSSKIARRVVLPDNHRDQYF